MNNTLRRFTHVNGFGDHTDYVEVSDDGTWLVFRDGTREKSNFTLRDCLKWVERGKWKEIPTGLQPDEFAVSIDDGFVEYRYVFPLGGHVSTQNVAEAVAKAFNVPCPEGLLLLLRSAPVPEPEPQRRPLTPEEVEILKAADITDWSGLYWGDCRDPFRDRPSFSVSHYTTTWTPDQIKAFRKWRKLDEIEVTRLRLAKPKDVSKFRLTGHPGVRPDFTGSRYETTLTPEEVLELCWRTPTEEEFAALKTWKGWDWEQIRFEGDLTARSCSFGYPREHYKTTLTDIRPWRRMTPLEAKVLKPGPRVDGHKTCMTEAEVVASL